jgi:two-component sensor histidine kinase
MGKINIRYWLCQILGWGLLGIIILYFNLIVFADKWMEQGGKKEYLISLGIFLSCGILTTHLLRTIIKRISWLKFSFNKIVSIFILSVFVTSILFFYGATIVEHNTKYSYDNYVKNKRLDKAKKIEADAGIDKIDYFTGTNKDPETQKHISEIKKATGWYRNSEGKWKYQDKTDLFGIYQNLLLISLWMLIYLVYHYVQKNRNDQLDRLKLENTVKELELKTIKSHINPHFIFNSLNSIRALVDENPERARTAITELSNILRSSMKAENAETVPFSRELDIVKDYLALEQMRFEERLQIEMYIDENILQQQVPPMMLQTLVENAIKHGISKQVSGGIVRVMAGFKEDKLQFLVQNTGQLIEPINEEGFGIKSTKDRLALMYQGNAVFEICSISNGMVESKVTIPIL